jgi:hypothetical protein
MSSQVLTISVFAVALVCGGWAHHHAKQYGKQHRVLDKALRLAFAISLFMAVWACSSYALWLWGAPLSIGTIARGHMADQWWLGPVCLIWAGLAYVELRREAN